MAMPGLPALNLKAMQKHSSFLGKRRRENAKPDQQSSPERLLYFVICEVRGPALVRIRVC